MKQAAKFLHSKVSRRIIMLFVSCALAPVMVLAFVSFYQVSSQLREEGRQQLSQTSKSAGMELYGRLEMLDAELQALSFEGADERSASADEMFKGIAVYGPDGRERMHWGDALPELQLTQAESRHLQSGAPLLRVDDCRGEPCVSLLRLTKSAGEVGLLLRGQVALTHLWHPDDLPDGRGLCLLSGSGQVLFASDENLEAIGDAFPAGGHSSGFYEWKNRGVEYDAAYWKVMVKPRFEADPWIVIVSQEHASVLGAALRFRRTFPLVILLSLWIVLLLSMVQIRRTLGPLEQLQEGTRQIGSQHFESRVEVRSGDEFETLASSFNAMAAQLGQQFGTLKTINDIGHAIFASLDRDSIVDGVLSHMPDLLGTDCFAVCIFEDARFSGWIRFRDAGSSEVHTERTSVSATDWMQLQNNPEAIVVTADNRIPDYLQPLSAAKMKSFMVLPIRVEHSIRAALVCARRLEDAPRHEDIHAARQVADQLAIALSHVRLIEMLEQVHWGTLRALARAIDAKSEWTAGHSERVTNLALEIGREMGLSTKDLRVIHMGGLLHDVGKIGTPQAILDKPAKLTDEEMRIMQQHVEIGLRILEPVPGLREALPLVAEHHEWFNGKGYPRGIAGQEISLHARVLAVADCFDAMTSDRPYRKGLAEDATTEILQSMSGVQFDPGVIEAFMRWVAKRHSASMAPAALAAGAR